MWPCNGSSWTLPYCAAHLHVLSGHCGPNCCGSPVSLEILPKKSPCQLYKVLWLFQVLFDCIQALGFSLPTSINSPWVCTGTRPDPPTAQACSVLKRSSFLVAPGKEAGQDGSHTQPCTSLFFSPGGQVHTCACPHLLQIPVMMASEVYFSLHCWESDPGAHTCLRGPRCCHHFLPEYLTGPGDRVKLHIQLP